MEWRSYMVHSFCVFYMYVRPGYLTCTSILDFLHVRPSWVSYMYVPPEYLTYTSVLSILHVRPSWVSYMYVRPKYVIRRVRIRISKNNTQHNGQRKKYKRTNNDPQTKDRVTGIPLKTGGELRCSGMVSSDIRSVNPIVGKPMVDHTPILSTHHPRIIWKKIGRTNEQVIPNSSLFDIVFWSDDLTCMSVLSI